MCSLLFGCCKYIWCGIYVKCYFYFIYFFNLGDRAKSKTPPPKLSDVSFELRKSLSKEDPEDEREGYKFLSLVDIEKDKILSEVKKLEEEMQKNSSIPEEASGKIRAACGKANLLISQKFEQFKGLCWKNIVRNFYF